MQRTKLLICQFTLFSATLVCTAAAQTGPQLGFVNKLGTEVDVRSGGRILADDIASSKVILPDLAMPVLFIRGSMAYDRLVRAPRPTRNGR